MLQNNYHQLKKKGGGGEKINSLYNKLTNYMKNFWVNVSFALF